MEVKKRKPTTSEQRGYKIIRTNRSLDDYDHLKKQEVARLGYDSYTEYLENLARKHGYSSFSEYKKHSRKVHGYATETEYKNSLAAKRGLKSSGRYDRELASVRKSRLRNRRLSHLMTMRMIELGLSVAKLSELTGISHELIYKYRKGENIPRRERLMILLKALGVDKLADEYD